MQNRMNHKNCDSLIIFIYRMNIYKLVQVIANNSYILHACTLHLL